MTSVLISVPTLGYIHKQVVYNLLQFKDDKRYDLRFIMPTHTPFENNLHHIVNDFMDGGEDYWLTIDNDNPPKRNPLDLVELDKDILGLPTPVWHCTFEKKGERPYYWNVYTAYKDAYKEYKATNGLHNVDAVGTGCVLFSRRVFEDPEMRKAPFQRTYHEDGTVYKGNDMAFCDRAKSNGFEIWAHLDYPCRHFIELNLMDGIKLFTNMMNKE